MVGSAGLWLSETGVLLFAETERVRRGHRLLADRLFEVVLLQLLRWLLDHPGQASVLAGLLAGLADPRLSRALVAMQKSPGKPWSLEALALTAGMSRSAFSAHFKRLVGQTPADHLTVWRLTIAQAQLRAGRPVKAIAAELDYRKPPALSRAFAQKLGASPRQRLASIG